MTSALSVARLLSLLLLVLAAACDPESCHIEDQVSDRLGSGTLVDCAIPVPDRFPDYAGMQQCVRAALAAQMPFLVVWDLPTIDSRAAYAYVGTVIDGAMVFYSFASIDNYIHAGPDLVTTVSTCTQLQDLGAECDAGVRSTTLCFSCKVSATDTCR